MASVRLEHPDLFIIAGFFIASITKLTLFFLSVVSTSQTLLCKHVILPVCQDVLMEIRQPSRSRIRSDPSSEKKNQVLINLLPHLANEVGSYNAAVRRISLAAADPISLTLGNQRVPVAAVTPY